MTKSNIKQWGISCVMGAVGGSVVLVLWLGLFAPKPKEIVTLDMVEITQHFIDQQLRASKENADHMQQVSEFSRQIDAIVKQLAQAQGVMVMPRQAVIAGGTDMTEQVKAMLFQAEAQTT